MIASAKNLVVNSLCRAGKSCCGCRDFYHPENRKLSSRSPEALVGARTQYGHTGQKEGFATVSISIL